jgi:hypothetical protein
MNLCIIIDAHGLCSWESVLKWWSSGLWRRGCLIDGYQRFGETLVIAYKTTTASQPRRPQSTFSSLCEPKITLIKGKGGIGKVEETPCALHGVELRSQSKLACVVYFIWRCYGDEISFYVEELKEIKFLFVDVGYWTKQACEANVTSAGRVSVRPTNFPIQLSRQV